MRWISKPTDAVSSLLLLSIMAIGCLDVVGSVVFAMPLPAAMDLAAVMFGAAIFLAWPGVQFRDRHIRVGLLTGAMGARMTKISHLASNVAGLVFFTFISIGIARHASSSWATKESAVAILEFPIYPGKILAAIGATVTLAVLLIQVSKFFRKSFEVGR